MKYNSDIFVPFNLALELSKIGFDTDYYFATWNIDEERMYGAYSKGVIEDSKHLIIAPTYEQVFNWLMNEHRVILNYEFSPYGMFYGTLIKDYTKRHRGMGNRYYFSNTISIDNGFQGYVSKSKLFTDAISMVLTVML